MKRKNTLWSLVLALVMVLGVFAPLSALADNANEPGDGKSTDPTEIEVVVHKILMDKFDGHDVNKEYEPAKGIQDIKTFFGNKAKEIGDVAFVAIKKGETGYDNFQQLSKEEQGKIYDDAAAGYKGTTNATNGLTLKLVSPGEYHIYEVKSRSTYVGDGTENDKKILAEQLAVPVKLKLPDHARTASGTVNKIHVYPKNTEDKPEVNKYVVKDKKDLAKASFDMTKEHTWAIEAKIPTGFKDYQRFELVDTLDKALSYVKGQADAGTITVQVGTKTSDKFEEVSPKVDLTKGTDYTITEPTETKGGIFKVALTNAGIQKLAKLEKDKGDAKNQAGFEGKLLRVEFKTTINEDAIMGKPIPNNVELKYGHTPDANGSTKPKNPPTVETGGKKFLKYDSGNETRKLAGAKFVVKNADGKYLAEEGSGENKKYVWKEVADNKVETLKKAGLKVLTSDTDGKFEIKGLEYDIENGTDYWLKEIEAPTVTVEGKTIKYALKDDDIKFTVNKTSYYTNPTEANPTEADPQKVDNKEITIPQTGGMGTMIFMVAGLALMGGAFIAMRKRSAEQA